MSGQRAQLFAQAAQTGSPFYRALPDSVLMLLTLALPFAFWFKPVVVLLAISWLFYRASQVLNKPLEELAALLGYDLPATPLIDLASVKADGAIVHWSLPDKQKLRSTLRYEIHINGAPADTPLSMAESAATITGLRPQSYYVVRISLVYNNELGSKSAAVRFRTQPASSGDFFAPPTDLTVESDAAHEFIPRVRPYRGLKGVAPPSLEAAPMTREGSAGAGSRKSLGGGRRSSPAVQTCEPTAEGNEWADETKTIQELTERLHAIRRETEEAERQAREEEEEELRQKEELARERDELKAEAAEKEKASRNLKREVNILERQNTAAQNERLKHERLLQQKRQDRQKLKDDLVRWARETEEMDAEVEGIHLDQDDHLDKAEQEKQALRARHADHLLSFKALDEEFKEKGMEIKKIERATKNNSPAGAESEPNLVQQFQQDAEERRNWENQFKQLQHQYIDASGRLEQAKRFYAEQARYLETLRAQRRQEDAAPYASPPATQERVPRRRDSQRSRRAASGHDSSESPRLATFTPTSSNVFAVPAPNPGSIFTSFLGHQHGVSMSGGLTEQMSMLDEDRQHMTGGAPMSPGAGADLIPTDLFNEPAKPSEPMQVLPGLGQLPGLPSFPGPVAPSAQDQPGPGPVSPTSPRSRSPSLFASPQASQQNLHIASPEQVLDSDHRSVRSNRSGRATSSGGYGSRFSGMFGIKQRSKGTAAEEGVALGQTHSHSMPRQDNGVPGLDSTTRKRNSSIPGINFGGSLVSDGALDGASDAVPPARRRAFNFFGKDKGDGGWPSNFPAFGRRPTSPRPGSTHSNELPRPSFDSSRWGVDAWPSFDSSSGARSSPLAFGSGWSMPSAQQSRLFGSRHPSRRPSVQYGASGPPEDILEDDDSDVLDAGPEAPLAPIGTKPSKRAEKEAAAIESQKLNPNATDFKSLFSGIKSRDKDKGRASSSSRLPSTPHLERGEADLSPPNSRKSKDTRDTPSITGTESSMAGSGRNSVDLALMPTYSNSETAGPSPLLASSGSTGRESFMQKLSRKSSSSKFALPTFKREKSKLDYHAQTSAAGASAPPAEDDEDGMSASVGSLKEKEAKDNRGSVGRNWGSVLKRGKRKANETPSLSEMSLTSGEYEVGEETEGM